MAEVRSAYATQTARQIPPDAPIAMYGLARGNATSAKVKKTSPKPSGFVEAAVKAIIWTIETSRTSPVDLRENTGSASSRPALWSAVWVDIYVLLLKGEPGITSQSDGL